MTRPDIRVWCNRIMNIVLLGYGAIAGFVAEKLRGDQRVRIAGIICRPGKEGDARQRLGCDAPCAPRLDMLPGPIDLLVECAGHQALLEHADGALSNGIDLLMVSNGALADNGFAARLERTATISGATIMLASGAIGALDAISAAKIGGIDQLVYQGRKPPAGWRGSAAELSIDLDQLSEPFTHFRGSAREAALQYPKNANVAATIALAGIGLDETMVELIADPAIDENIHQVQMHGAFGRMQFTIAGNPLPDNPRSSALTAMSVIAAINRRLDRLVV